MISKDSCLLSARVGLWELCLLAFVVIVAMLYCVIALRFVGIIYADGAYYYGVARHMALTGRFEEPIVWHFLSPPDHILHAPFDYWGGMTSLLLVPALAIFGATPTTAILTMAAISAAAVLAFWYLVCIALPLRYRATQLLAIVLFAFSPAMNLYRFQPESITVAQLFIVLSVIAYCRQQLALSVLFGFCLALTRGDGVILFALILVAALLRARVSGARRVLALGAVGGACIASYVIWSFVAFGTPTPPAAQLVPFLSSYWEVYNYDVPRTRLSVSVLRERLTGTYILARLRLGFETLRSIPFVPLGDLWLGLGLLALPAALWHRAGAKLLIWVLCFGGYLGVVLISGPGFAPVRTPYTFTPLLVLAGAFGLDEILAQLDRWITRRSPRARTVLLAATEVAVCALFFAKLAVFQNMPYDVGATLAIQKDLPKLDEILQGGPVISNRSFDVAAFTRSPSVSIPANGIAAVQAVIERYGVRWLVLFNPPKKRPFKPRFKRNPFEELASLGWTDVGPFRIEEAHIESPLPAVYRVRRRAPE